MDVERRITHVELLYAPGERALAARLFVLLGCTVVDSGRHWFTAFVDDGPGSLRDALRTDVAALAVKGAEQILKREIDANAHAELLNQLKAEL